MPNVTLLYCYIAKLLKNNLTISERERAKQFNNLTITSGFSLVEILLTLFFAAALGTILLTSTGTLSTGYRSNLQSIATKIASKDIENLRKLDFALLPADTGQTCLQDLATDLAKLPNPCHTRQVSNFQNDADIKLITTTVTWYESGAQACALSTCVIKMNTLIYKNGL